MPYTALDCAVSDAEVGPRVANDVALRIGALGPAGSSHLGGNMHFFRMPDRPSCLMYALGRAHTLPGDEVALDLVRASMGRHQ